MFYRIIEPALKLELVTPEMGEAIFRLTDRNRDYLRKWLPWVDGTKTPEDTKKFAENSMQGFAKRESLNVAIVLDGEIVGIAGFYLFQWATKTGRIGYWLCEDRNGKGLMTKAVRELEKIAFMELGLSKTEIHCAVANSRSRAIPERLGYLNEGTIRNAENLNGVSTDHILYGLLKEEYLEREHATGM